VSARIPKAEDLFKMAAAYLGYCQPKGPEPFTTHATWVIHVASARLALRCAEEDGEREAVEREAERLYRMLSAAAGTEDIIADERKTHRENLS
jgi:hypothetical protein